MHGYCEENLRVDYLLKGNNIGWSTQGIKILGLWLYNNYWSRNTSIPR